MAIPLLERAGAQSNTNPDAPASWPSAWTSQDVGDVGAAGSSQLSGSRLVVRGSGADVWGVADEFHFAHTTVNGDFELSAYVAHVDDLDRWTKAGLMIRDGVSANARHAFLLATPRAERGVAFQRRPVTAGSSVHTAGPATAPPVWLQLTRRGDVVTAAIRASDSEPWMQVGEQSFSGLPQALNVGFAMSSHVDGAQAEAWFEQIALTSLQQPPSTWTSSDVGEVGAPGHSSVDEDSGPEFTVTGSGADVWGTADEFHFLSREVTGNFDFSARMAFVDDLDKWTKAGLMMREGLAAGARHAFIIQTPRTERGVAFQRRPVAGGSSTHTPGPGTAPPGFLRLVRAGDVIRAYHKGAVDDLWVLIGTQTFTSLPATVRIGFAVSSHVDGSLATGYFDNYQLTLGDPEWVATDIGDVGAAGRSFVDEDSGPEFTVHGSGADVWGTNDEFHFLSREVVGDFDFSARAGADGLDKWTKVGLMMRDGLAANARHAFIIQTPRTERGVAFQRRPATGGLSLHTAGPATAPSGFLRLVRQGDVVSAYHKLGPYDPWVLIGTQTFTSLPATLRIGFAVSSHVDGSLATGYFDNLILLQQSR